MGGGSEEAESRGPGQRPGEREGWAFLRPLPVKKKAPLLGTSTVLQEGVGGPCGRTPHLASASDQSLILERGPDILCICMTEVAVCLA